MNGAERAGKKRSLKSRVRMKEVWVEGRDE